MRLLELHERHAPMIRALCRMLLRDAVEAEDAAQQTFLSAYRALLSGVVPREPAAWIAAIARNECLARIRTRMREPLAVPVDERAAAHDALSAAIAAVDAGAIWAAVRELPDRQRRAFLLREFGGLSYEELAVALGVSVPAVESLLVRARGQLRVALAPLRESFPSLGRLAPWPFAAKLAATTVGAGLVVGGGFLGARDEGGPMRADPRPASAAAAVERPATEAPVWRGPIPAPAPPASTEAEPQTESHDAAEPQDTAEPQDAAQALDTAEPQGGGDHGDGGDTPGD